MRRSLILILVFVFIDVLGFSLILPLLPYYAADFQASSITVGLLLSANALTQMIGAPFLGRLSDRYGRKPMLIASISGTVLSFLILGFANSLAILFLSRIMDGLLGGNVSLAQAYITDTTTRENRAQGLGLIGAAFGVGFIFGPALGGSLSAGGNYALPAFAAAGLAALNLVGVLIWLPESLPPENRTTLKEKIRPKVSLGELINALRRPCVGPLLSVVLIYGLAFTMFETMFSLFTQQKLGFSAQTTSYVLTYVGVVVVLVQGVGIRWLSARFSDKQMIYYGAILLIGGLLGWAYSFSLPVLLIALLPLALASGMLRVSTNSALTKNVDPSEVGGILGLSASMNSLTRVAAPLIGSFLLAEISPAGPGVAGALLMIGVVLITWKQILNVPDLDCEPPGRSVRTLG
ncbi:MAG TPA: major facilitator superfamily domain-containing protein 9 [Anaerolineae bacterium]|nr:major facilitator superfamily domain-containing protein 9 [Anaerolineae bacterium]